ncbi:hypothetical protein [Blastococcus colisei]|uniref:hypothetical protein n=1 Tax=Blastococcus colisei TaxID=1564162 RepID=UPI001151A557|nr:hypothetical protein [Blastococcus colisei]
MAARARALRWGEHRPHAGDKPRHIWREQVLIRANELTGLAIWMGTRESATSDQTLLATNSDRDAALWNDLTVARDAALGRSRWPSGARARMERAAGSLDAAEAVLLSRSPDDYLRGQLPGLVAHVQAHLPLEHPLRACTLSLHEKYAAPADEADGNRVAGMITGEDRTALVEAVRAAGWAERREYTRLRSFCTAVAVTAVALTLLALAIAAVSALRPTWMPLCFAPQGMNTVVCPTATAAVEDGEPASGTTDGEGSGPAGGTAAGAGETADGEGTTDTGAAARVASTIRSTAQGTDTAVVMLVGLAGAAVTGAAALRRLRGSSTPFAVPLTLLLLKLPAGALTAFLGLILLHGEFVPGLSALDTSGQILAWALLFGAAQQLVTGLVDKQGQEVLDSVGSTPMKADKE